MDSHNHLDRSYLWINKLEEHAVTIAFIEAPGEEPDPDEAWSVAVSAETISQDGVLRRLYTALHNDDGSERSPYILTTRREHYSWGAEAISSAIVLFVAGAASTGIIGNAAYDALKATIRQLRYDNPTPCEPLGRDEAFERGIWMLEQRYGLDRSVARLVSEEQAGESFRFRLESADHITAYTVTVEVADGLVLVTRTRRGQDD